jgi:Flp pilus assembly protein TadD
LGRLYAELGKAQEAEAVLRHASWLDVHDAESLNLIAVMDVGQHRLEEAYAIQRRAVSRQPNQPRQYLLLSDILTQMGRTEEARAALAQVSEMKATASASSAMN